MSLTDKIRGKKKKKPIEGDMVIDNPDIKIVAVSHKGKPFVVGIGTTEDRQVEGEAAINLPTGGKGRYQTQKVLKWKILFDPKVLPNLKPLENENVARASIALASGSSVALDRTLSAVKEVSSQRLGSWVTVADVARASSNQQRSLSSESAYLRLLVKRGLIVREVRKKDGKRVYVYRTEDKKR